MYFNEMLSKAAQKLQKIKGKKTGIEQKERKRKGSDEKRDGIIIIFCIKLTTKEELSEIPLFCQ